MGFSLDDTLHAVVQLTHDHGLPLDGVHVHPGRVQVFTGTVDVRWWARWLTAESVDLSRPVVREDGNVVNFHLNATREGIEWTVCQPVPIEIAAPILAVHDITVSARHIVVPAAAAVALADALVEGEGLR